MASPIASRPEIMSLAPEGTFYLIPGAVGNYVSDPRTTKHYKEVRVHVYAVPNGDSETPGEQLIEAVVYLEQSLDGNAWVIVATITNPDESGEMYVLDPAPLTRARVTGYSEENFALSAGIYVVLEKA